MLDQEDITEVESDGLLGQARTTLRKESRYWLFACCLFGISITLNIVLITLALVGLLETKQSPVGNYENGFTSDLNIPKSEIEIVQQVFDGGVKLNHGEFVTDRGSEQYVGFPTPEIDHAWNALLTGLNIDIASSEANLSNKTFQWPESGSYFTGFEVFHSLHCLNRLRQALYPDYYDVFSNPNDPSREDHIGHCINHLRQALQCHSDLTPMEWIRIDDKIILNTATRHTCRNFGKIHDWAKIKRTHFDEIQSIVNNTLFVVD